MWYTFYMTKQLITKIKPIAHNALQLFSWVEGQKAKTYYCHGEFKNVNEICASVCARKHELKLTWELGEWSE